MSKYESSSSDPESLIEPERTLRSSQHSLMSPTASQGSDFSTSPTLTTTCVTKLKRFHFSPPKPKPKRRCILGVRKNNHKGNQWNGKSSPLRAPVPSTPVSSAYARKLKFESPLAVEKLDFSFHSDVHQDVAASVSEPVGNCIINFQLLQSMFDQMLCGQCATGRIFITISSKKRSTKKQLRPKKVRQQVKKFGEGYFSGKFSGAKEHSDPDSPLPNFSE